MEKLILLAFLLATIVVTSMSRTESPPHIVVVHTVEPSAYDEVGCFPLLSLIVVVITALVVL